MVSTIDMQMTAEDAKPKRSSDEGTAPTKITKLPRNGPKKGQSMNSWLHGKRLGDADWARQIRKAQDQGKI